VLRKIFGPITDKVTQGWRKLHTEELHNMYSSPSIIRMIKSRRIRWAGHVAPKGDKRNAYRILVRRPEGKMPLGRPKHRWMNNIKMYLKETGRSGMDWNDLAHDRDQWRALVYMAMNFRDSIKCLENS
jgi:hypothetical protein